MTVDSSGVVAEMMTSSRKLYRVSCSSRAPRAASGLIAATLRIGLKMMRPNRDYCHQLFKLETTVTSHKDVKVSSYKVR